MSQFPWEGKPTIVVIRRRFFEALEAKTGWGKEELKRTFDDIVIEVLSGERPPIQVLPGGAGDPA